MGNFRKLFQVNGSRVRRRFDKLLCRLRSLFGSLFFTHDGASTSNKELDGFNNSLWHQQDSSMEACLAMASAHAVRLSPSVEKQKLKLELLRGSRAILESLPVSVVVHEPLVRAGCMFFGTATWRTLTRLHRQCYMDMVDKLGYKCPTRCTVRQTFLHSNGRDCFRLHRNHFLPFSFFLLHFSTTFCSALWRSSWYVGVIHRNADRKNHFLSSNGVFDNFCTFCKVESPIFGFLDKKTFKRMQTCTYKSLTCFVLERFFKSLYRPIQLVQVAKG